MQISDPAYQSARYRLAVESGSRKREAAFELALKSTTPFSVGDRVSYYITAGKGPSYDRARLASDWNALSRDEDLSGEFAGNATQMLMRPLTKLSLIR